MRDKPAKTEAVAFIFARGGSKGIPRKNLSLLAGRTLLERAIQTAKDCKYVRTVVVSTDDTEIAEMATKAQALVPFLRPHKLAQDESSEWLAWQHAIDTTIKQGLMKMNDLFISVPATSPFRHVGDLETSIETLCETGADLVVSVTPAKRDPMFNMVRMSPDGRVGLAQQPKRPIPGRQFNDYPIYDMTTVAYSANPTYILNAETLFQGRVYATIIPEERALDIDTPLDLAFAEFLMNRESRVAHS